MGTVDRIIRLAIKGISSVGRTIEFLLTGEAHYFFATSELAEIEMVDDRIKANRLLADVKVMLAGDFGLFVERPVIVEIEPLEGTDLRTALLDRRGALGRYHRQDMGEGYAHCIAIVAGLPTNRFKSVLAHEYAHAWLREKSVLPANKGLREGLARWIEYKVLLKLGEKREAAKVRGTRFWSYGKGVHRFLALEAAVGQEGVLDALMNRTDTR